MAIYHLNMSHGSIKGGQSARAKLDYISRHGKYKKREDLCRLVESSNLPLWAKDQKKFWGAVDDNERANARLFSELEFALPVELDQEKQLNLVRSFAQERLPKQPYTFAIHEGKGENPHCHLIYSERMDDGIQRTEKTFFKRANPKKPELGGAKKNRSLKEKAFLIDTREKWADAANVALLIEKPLFKKAVQIDHRTLEAQGIEREPQLHRGYKLDEKIKRKLIFSREKDHGTNIQQRRTSEIQGRDLKEDSRRISNQIATIRKQAQQEDRRRSIQIEKDLARRVGDKAQKFNDNDLRRSRSIERKDAEIWASLSQSVQRIDQEVTNVSERIGANSRKESKQLEGMGRELSAKRERIFGKLGRATAEARRRTGEIKQVHSYIEGAPGPDKQRWQKGLQGRIRYRHHIGKLNQISARITSGAVVLQRALGGIVSLISRETIRSTALKIGELIRPTMESYKHIKLEYKKPVLEIPTIPKELKHQNLKLYKVPPVKLPEIKTGKSKPEKKERSKFSGLRADRPRRNMKKEQDIDNSRGMSY